MTIIFLTFIYTINGDTEIKDVVTIFLLIVIVIPPMNCNCLLAAKAAVIFQSEILAAFVNYKNIEHRWRDKSI